MSLRCNNGKSKNSFRFFILLRTNIRELYNSNNMNKKIHFYLLLLSVGRFCHRNVALGIHSQYAITIYTH